MTTEFGFYDSTSGDRVYTSQDFSNYIGQTRSDGYCLQFNDELLVEESGTPGMSVVVNTGGAFVQGRFLQVTAAETLNIATADPTNPRIDRIVVRADESSGVRETLLAVLTGTPAGSPTAPALTRTSTIWEISLAQIAVAANETEITDAEITDERNVIAVCGISSIFGGHRGIGARVRRSTNQSINASSTAQINFDTVIYDNFNFFDAGADTRLTVNHDGLYLLTANINFLAVGNIDIRKNGTTTISRTENKNTVSLVFGTSTVHEAVKGDYFELSVINGSAGAANVTSNSEFSPILTISLIGVQF